MSKVEYESQPGDIITLWRESIDGTRYTYEYQGRWTAKSLIITANEDADMPLCYKEGRFMVPREKAVKDLDEKGSVWVAGLRSHLELERYEVRNADAIEEAEERARKSREEYEAKLAAITPYQWRLIHGFNKAYGEKTEPLMVLFVLDQMQKHGQDVERFLGRRQIDDL
jgi:hypothetical protein